MLRMAKSRISRPCWRITGHSGKPTGSRVVNPARLAQADHLPGRDPATKCRREDVARRYEGRRLAGGGMRRWAKLWSGGQSCGIDLERRRLRLSLAKIRPVPT